MNDDALQEIIDRVTGLFVAQREEAEQLREQLAQALVYAGIEESIPPGWHLVYDIDGGWYIAPLATGGNFPRIVATAYMALQSLKDE